MFDSYNIINKGSVTRDGYDMNMVGSKLYAQQVEQH